MAAVLDTPTVQEIQLNATDYVRVGVITRRQGVLYDPRMSATAEFAFTQAVDPVSTDWHSGAWETAQSKAPWVATILVGSGPGGVPLDLGDYLIWVRITDTPTKKILPAGTLRIY